MASSLFHPSPVLLKLLYEVTPWLLMSSMADMFVFGSAGTGVGLEVLVPVPSASA